MSAQMVIPPASASHYNYKNEKLGYFRVKELKDVLTQLGLAKQGRKQDLVDRILAVVSDDQVSKMQGGAKKNPIGREGVAKIIDDTYRKMQISGATELASKGQSDSDVDNGKPKEEVDNSVQLDMKVRCPCGTSLPTESMIQCEDTRCLVWQHIGCVVIPEKPMEGVPPLPSQFYCEICRLNRADPFWVTTAHPLLPVKLTVLNLSTDGTNQMQNEEKTFHLTRVDRELIQRTDYDVQAWCILLNDKVLFRMQWPQFSDLQVNGVPVRTINRPGTQLLGANGRDDGPAITTCTRDGMNKISLSRCDARIFCLGVRIVRRRTVQQVLNLIPKELDGERFEDALARVCRCIGGGNAAENADSDSDLEVVADSVTVNLRCPMSGSRIKTAGRFQPCVHMGCFDLDTFVELNQRSRKASCSTYCIWQCPICLKNYSLENIIIDPYFNRISTMMRNCGEDVTDIDVKPDGSWRAKNENEHWDLAQWHFPDGSLCVATGRDIKSDLETLKQIKQERTSEAHNVLKLGIKKNRNGTWEVSKPEHIQTPSSENQLEEKYDIHCQKVVPMSSSATGSCRDGEDRSVNQDAGGHFDFSANNCNELDSISLNLDSAYGVANRIPSAPVVNADVIILSDSEDENENLIPHEAVYETGQINACGTSFSVLPPGVPDSYPEDTGLVTGSGSCIGLLNGNGDEFGVPVWPSFPSSTQAGPGFQLFGTETDVSGSLVNIQHTSITCPTSMNGGYSMAPDMPVGSATQIPESVCHYNTNMNGGLVGNPLTFGEDDPSLQIFLPTRPAASSAPTDTRDQPVLTNGIREEDWISLRVGDGVGSVGHGQSAAANGLNARHQVVSKEGRLESLANTASLLLSTNGGRSDKTITNQKKSDSPFSFPRQPRLAPYPCTARSDW
ncbi:zinc finger protein [Macleaya cordata]|uniref:Zinc finger protein n=1 Tax=Macleaya cordata TaxID=56857 RepID=A0A200R5Y7_MACCD|nr:zinc finger protein [Macleaya cordata]